MDAFFTTEGAAALRNFFFTPATQRATTNANFYSDFTRTINAAILSRFVAREAPSGCGVGLVLPAYYARYDRSGHLVE